MKLTIKETPRVKTAKEWLLAKFPLMEAEWDMTGHDDSHMVKMMEEYVKYVSITCHHCTDSDSCEYAFDDYNTNGDCLAIK